jgi:hypothetical protein
MELALEFINRGCSLSKGAKLATIREGVKSHCEDNNYHLIYV